MGVVYRPEEVSGRAVPTVDDLSDLMRSVLKQAATSESIVGALAYGSVPNGTATVRSDVDIYVRHEPGALLQAQLEITAARVQARQRGVYGRVETSYVSSEDAPPLTDRLYISHFTHTAQLHPECMTGQPLSGFPESSPSTCEIIDECRQYLHAKRDKFLRALDDISFVSAESIDYKDLQRAFELPSAIGRKVLHYFNQTELFQYDPSNRSSVNATLSKVYAKLVEKGIAGAAGALELRDDLLQMDRGYSNILDATRTGDIGVDVYTDWICMTYPQAIRHAVALSDIWSGIFSQVTSEPQHKM